MNFVDWLKANWPLIAPWVVIVLVFVVYVVRRFRKGEAQQLVSEALALVREMARDAAKEIDREDVAFIVGNFYDLTLAKSDLAKLIGRDTLIEAVWELWQKHMRVEATVRAALHAETGQHFRRLGVKPPKE